MRLSLSFIAFIIAAVCAFNVAPAYAAIYRFIDKDGTEHITNDFQQIPKEYQEQFIDKSEPKKPNEVITAEKELKEAVAAAKAIESQTIMEKATALIKRNNARLPLQIIAAIAAIIAIFYGGSYVGVYLGNKKLATLICLALAAFVLIYLVSVNLQHVADDYQDIMGKVNKLETKLNERQKQLEKRIETPEGQSNETPQISPIKLPD